MTSQERESFDLANKAFALMTPLERLIVLERFARLHYPSIVDRFFDAVHGVIVTRERDETTPPPPALGDTET